MEGDAFDCIQLVQLAAVPVGKDVGLVMEEADHVVLGLLPEEVSFDVVSLPGLDQDQGVRRCLLIDLQIGPVDH